MIPTKKNRRGVWLTVLGLVTATSAIVVTSECTTPGSAGNSRQPANAAWLTAPATPPAIAPPPDATVTAHFKATGAQIYKCGATGVDASGATTGYAWTLQAPEARLLDADGVEVGSHAAGPTWKSSKDGSSVAATKVAQADARAPGAIPWLLLRASSTTPGGVFSPVTFIQRVNTSGGQAPPAGCDAAAAAARATTSVAYTADYIFFKTAAHP